MFDTNVFNRILDGMLSLQTLTGRVVACATHIQRDEIINTTNPERRAALAQIFGDVVERVVPTESAVYGVSRYGQAKYGAEDDLYSALKGRLDSINGSKPNNVHDALIAETSIRGGHVLVTDDTDLAAVTKHYGGRCLSVADLQRG